MIKRRTFIAGLGSAAAWPVVARAQQRNAIARVGVLLRHAYGMPAMFWDTTSVAAGALASYGPNFVSAWRQVGLYVGRILKGEKPADLAVVQLTDFELQPQDREGTGARSGADAACNRQPCHRRMKRFSNVQRREFIAGLGSAAAWPRAARAQQLKMPVIGWLAPGSPGSYAGLPAFLQGLGKFGYVGGRNVAVEYRWAEGNGLVPGMAADLVRRQVDVIVAITAISALAAKDATRTIPIVFTSGADPVEFGLVPRLNSLGGNLTGIYSLGYQLDTKRLELLHEAVPAATVINVLVNPSEPRSFLDTQRNLLEAAARTLGLRLQFLEANNDRECEAAFAGIAEMRTALLIGTDAFFSGRKERLGALAARYAVPAIYVGREFVAGGGLMACGAPVAEMSHVVGTYTGRILKGEKPSDLPVQQATRIEMILNLKAAKALGIEVPTKTLLSADEVIE